MAFAKIVVLERVPRNSCVVWISCACVTLCVFDDLWVSVLRKNASAKKAPIRIRRTPADFSVHTFFYRKIACVGSREKQSSQAWMRISAGKVQNSALYEKARSRELTKIPNISESKHKELATEGQYTVGRSRTRARAGTSCMHHTRMAVVEP